MTDDGGYDSNLMPHGSDFRRELAIIPPEPIEGEIITGGMFLERNPFKPGAMQWIDVDEGSTLTAYYEAAAANLPPEYRPFIELWIDEAHTSRQYWQNIKPKPGHTVYARVRPGNGKTVKNVLRAALMIAVIAAATYFLGPASGIFGAGVSFGGAIGLSGFAATLATTLAIAAVTTVGMLAVNALIPAPGLTNPNGTPKPSLTGSSNQFAPFAPVPRVFGKLRIFPLVAGYPYTEIVGNKQYLRMLLLCGWGPLNISDIRIGNTPINLYKNVEVEINEGGPTGWAGNTPITLYNRTVHEVPLSTQLTQAGGASVPQTTSLNTIEIGVDITFPFGLCDIDKNGNHTSRTVQIYIEYRTSAGPGGVPAAGAWTAAPLERKYEDDNTGVNGGYLVATAASQDAVRVTGRMKLAAGQYDVRCTRTTADSGTPGGSTQHLDGSYWTTLRSFTPDAPVNQTGVCTIAIRMQASDQLNGTPAQINCMAQSYLPVWGIGNELLTNGNGSSSTGWTAVNATVSITAPLPGQTYSRLRVINTATNGYIYQSFTTVIGHRYVIYYDRFQWNAVTAARVMVGNSAGDNSLFDDQNSGDTYGGYVVVVATATTTFITLECMGNVNNYSEFTDISAKDLDAASNAWNWQKTRNPAWAFTDVLRRRGGATYIADTRIDYSGSIAAWANSCDQTAPNAPEPYWSFDGVISGGTIYDALKQIASTGRAAYTMRDGKFAVVQDKSQATPVQLITPKNSWNYSASRTYLLMPDAYRVQFINAALNYKQDEVFVYNTGKNASNSSLFETLKVDASSKTQAWREGSYHLAVANLRPEEHRVNMDIEGLRCTMGDRVQLAYDVMGVGLSWGRIVAITTSGANTIAFTVDEDCTFQTGVNYVMRARNGAGTISMRTVTAAIGTTRTLNVTAEPTSGGPQIGDLFIFGQSTIETAPMIVKKIEPADDLAVSITMANYDEGVYSADSGTIPAFTSYLGTDPANTPPADPTVVLRCDHTSRLMTGIQGSNSRIAVDITTPAGRITITGYEVQFRVNTDTMWKSVGNIQPVGVTTVYIDDSYGGLVLGLSYTVRVRSVGENGLRGNWIQPPDIQVTSGTLLPNAPTAMSAASGYHSITLNWTNPPDLDFATVEIWGGTVNAQGSSTLLGTSKTGTFTYTTDGAVLWYFWLRSKDTVGNYSAYVEVDANGTMADNATTGGDNVLPDPYFYGGSGTLPSRYWVGSGGGGGGGGGLRTQLV